MSNTYTLGTIKCLPVPPKTYISTTYYQTLDGSSGSVETEEVMDEYHPHFNNEFTKSLEFEDDGKGAIIVDAQGNKHDLFYNDFDKNPYLADIARLIKLHAGRVSVSESLPDWKTLENRQVLFLKDRKDSSGQVYVLSENTGDWKKAPVAADSLAHPVDDAGVINVGVAVLLEALDGGLIDTGKFALERMQVCAHPETPVKIILKLCLERLKNGKTTASKKHSKYQGIESFFMERVANVSYQGIHPGAECLIEKTGAEFKKAVLPWSQIGKPGLANPGQALSRDDTLKSRKIGSANVIYCKAFLRDNQLTSYG